MVPGHLYYLTTQPIHTCTIIKSNGSLKTVGKDFISRPGPSKQGGEARTGEIMKSSSSEFGAPSKPHLAKAAVVVTEDVRERECKIHQSSPGSLLSFVLVDS